jgi:hypothetical protein
MWYEVVSLLIELERRNMMGLHEDEGGRMVEEERKEEVR